jgi:hypothetical protein
MLGIKRGRNTGGTMTEAVEEFLLTTKEVEG